MDADIILTYDLSETVRRMLGKKGIAKAGSPVARSLCRRLGAEVKLTPKSNEVSGMTGRLGFDLQKQVEKDHRLVDYSLGALSQHFCRIPLPELSAATRAKILQCRPRAYAQHLLRQAEASANIFHHLAYLYNFVEPRPACNRLPPAACRLPLSSVLIFKSVPFLRRWPESPAVHCPTCLSGVRPSRRGLVQGYRKLRCSWKPAGRKVTCCRRCSANSFEKPKFGDLYFRSDQAWVGQMILGTVHHSRPQACLEIQSL